MAHSRLQQSWKWTRVHVCRHLPFAVYTACTVCAMAWIVLRVVSIL